MTDQAIAIIGMAGRFPGAAGLDEFWSNLRSGTETLSYFTHDELRAEGFDEATLRDPGFVPAWGALAGSGLFDAAFFDYTPREAELIDPQQRIFLELAAEALERANVVSGRDVRVGVLGGSAMNTYLLQNILRRPDLLDPAAATQLIVSNDKDYLALRVSYKLDLTGPALTVQTSCSSSLVAVHLGCRMLLTYDADVVLAGGATVGSPQRSGYVHRPGGVASPDGHCRAFDERAAGLAPASGAGVVVLKRLEDALADRDVIHAVVLGSAINNDGSSKVGFTAPSVAMQAEVITEAHQTADVDAASISYVEAHGTATPLGDLVEVTALTRAFRRTTAATTFCALGSVKTNFGHLDAAAGVAGLIKTVLSLEHAELPPSLNFERPNPDLALDESPFFVNTALRPWRPPTGPRRAGVSAFGLGGTNAHVVVEQAPPPAASVPSPWPQLLQISTKSGRALPVACRQLADHLAARPELDLADVAETLARGRRTYANRHTVVCSTREEAVAALRNVPDGLPPAAVDRPVVFLFPGVTAIAPGVGRDLGARYPAFRSAVLDCSRAARADLDIDLMAVIAADPTDATAAEALQRPVVSAAATFTMGYAMARLLLSWGITPRAMVGHSLGEYVAAAVAGVLSLDDALLLVIHRYRLLSTVAAGAMLNVTLPAAQVVEHLAADPTGAVDVAAVNGPSSTVVSGSDDAIERLTTRLTACGVPTVRLRVPIATHSALLDPVLDEFAAVVGRITLHPPERPYISSLTGTWAEAATVQDPAYWVRQFRETVQFADALATLDELGTATLIEVGAGQALRALVMHRPDAPVVLSLSPHHSRAGTEMTHFLTTMGALWRAGTSFATAALAGPEQRKKVQLPTHPMTRETYWFGEAGPAPATGIAHGVPAAASSADPDLDIWFTAPTWTRAPLDGPRAVPVGGVWLVLPGSPQQGHDIGVALGAQATTVLVDRGSAYLADGNRYVIDPADPQHYARMLADVQAGLGPIAGCVHAWTTLPIDHTTADPAAEAILLVGALAMAQPQDLPPLWIVTVGAHDVTGTEALVPTAAAVVGALRPGSVAPGLPRVRALDVTPADPSVATAIVEEIMAVDTAAVVARRARHRWVRSTTPLAVSGAARPDIRGGTYLLSGDLDELSTAVVEHLRAAHDVTFVRLGLPDDVIEVAIADLPEAVREVRRRHGDIDGVVHTGGPDPDVIAAVLADHHPYLGLVFVPRVGGAAAAAVEVDVDAANRRGAGRWLGVTWDPAGYSAAEIAAVVDRLPIVADHAHVTVSSRPSSTSGDTPHAVGPSAGSRHARPDLPTPFVAPRSEIEEAIAAVWEELMGIAPLGVHDDFFALGGHSLLGTQVVARLRQIFEVDVPFAEIYQATTIAELGQLVLRCLANETADVDLEQLLAEVEAMSEPAANATDQDDEKTGLARGAHA